MQIMAYTMLKHVENMLRICWPLWKRSQQHTDGEMDDIDDCDHVRMVF